jgi:hypothetical protein
MELAHTAQRWNQRIERWSIICIVDLPLQIMEGFERLYGTILPRNRVA